MLRFRFHGVRVRVNLNPNLQTGVGVGVNLNPNLQTDVGVRVNPNVGRSLGWG